MVLLLVGATVVWLAVCLFVVALCIVAKQGDAVTMSTESPVVERSLTATALQGPPPAAAGTLRLV